MRRRAVAVLSRIGAVVLVAAVLLAGCARSGLPPDADGRGVVGGGEAAPATRDTAAARTDSGRVSAARRVAARRVERGRALLSEGELRRAAAVLERALRIDPAFGEAYLALARVRLALGEEARAAGLLDRAVELLRASGSPAAARAERLRSRLREDG